MAFHSYKISILFIIVHLLLLLPSFVQDIYAQTGWAYPFEEAVVVTAEERASEAGFKIMGLGGNAVDAAVAIQFTLAVTLPGAGTIGGGGFMVIRLQDGTVTTLDFRESAPAAAHRNMYLDDSGIYQPDLSQTGALSIGVPGTVEGMITALEHYGRLPLEVVMEPAIRLALEGYELSYTQALSLNNASEKLIRFNSSKNYFVKTDGSPWREGDLFVQQDLGETLQRIARNGRRGFYTGITAQRIVEEMSRQGGLITYEDLRNYSSTWREPVVAEFQEYELFMMPPPSSGGIILKQVLGMIEPFNPGSAGFNSADYIHLLSEALRRSFADRNHYLGDPDFTETPLNTLTDINYLNRRMRDFRADRVTDSRNISHGRIYETFESSETTHFSIVDREGNGVAVTTTLNSSFGSKLAVSGAGFLLNNEMDDFSAKPGEPNLYGLTGSDANAIEPGKRMLSSMSPTIVTKDGDIRMIIGAEGGPKIISSLLQVFLNHTLFDMNPMESISAPRFHHQWLPDRLTVEKFTLSADTENILRNRGHNIFTASTIGIVHLIIVDEDKRKYGVPDPRGDGSAKGK
jgi:gamma-glutamyltranspeptidase / glutathione hydrolase